MRAACLGGFQPEIQKRRCDAFYVRINSKMTVPQRQKALENSRNEFCRVQKMHPELYKNEVKLFMIKQRIASMVEFGKWKDKWLEHPFPDMSEPEKSICYLTDYSDYDAGSLGLAVQQKPACMRLTDSLCRYVVDSLFWKGRSRQQEEQDGCGMVTVLTTLKVSLRC